MINNKILKQLRSKDVASVHKKNSPIVGQLQNTWALLYDDECFIDYVDPETNKEKRDFFTSLAEAIGQGWRPV